MLYTNQPSRQLLAGVVMRRSWSLGYIGLGRVVGSGPFRLALALAIGKVAVFLAVFAVYKSPDFLYAMSTRWDSDVFEKIASGGYTLNWYYVVPPIYPALIRGVSSVVGPAWISGLLVTNALSFVFPMILYKTFGFRTALLAELFPTYLVFTTTPHSDVVTLVFLALSVFFVFRARLFFSSFSAALAMANLYNAAWAIPSYFLAFRGFRWPRRVLFLALPLAAGALTLLWYKLETGNFLTFLSIESSVFQVGPADPITQVGWILNANGLNRFNTVPWQIFSTPITPGFWLVRDLLFESFYFFGAFYLLKMETPYRHFLFAFSLSVSLPLLFFVGLPIANPRLLLAAFPVFYSYSALIKKKFDWIYSSACYALAMAIILIQTFAWFS